jgi:hypothetical protein
MSSEGLASAKRFLVFALSALYAIAAAAGLFLLEFDTGRDIGLWIGFLVAGAALLLLGELRVRPGIRSAAVVSVGAALGGLPLFWTLLVPIAVAAVIACSIALARRDSAPA